MIYANEKHRQEIYKEDCMWLTAIPNLQEKHRDILVQPYSQQKKQNKPKNTLNVPIKTKEQTIAFIFEGMQ